MPTNTSKPRKSRKLFWLIALLTFLVVGTGLVYALNHGDGAKTADTSQSGNGVDYSGPTSEEEQAGNSQKQENAEKQQQTAPSSASVIISNTSQAGDIVRVRAFVSNSVESGGSCTTTLTNGSNIVTKQTASFADASTTQCGAIDFNRSQFAVAGTWQVSVKYHSSKLDGSASGNITIE